ncbi:MAG: lytic transglycosylase domain-containing protein [Nitrospinota bacterium]|nr:lytic transglycosylase domain-containing protein [Nitrospinota bacterium]
METNRFCSAVLLVFFISTPLEAYADVYRYVDENGTVQFTDKRISSGSTPYIREKPEQKKVKRGVSIKRKKGGRESYADYRDEIYKLSVEEGMEPRFIKSVIKAESAFDRYAISSAGAVGLMQLMPATAKNYGVLNPFIAEDNIRGGTRYLKYLLEKYNGNKELALAAYNAGENAVEKYSGIPPYPETIGFIRRVMDNYYDRPYKAGKSAEGKAKIYRYIDDEGVLHITDTPIFVSDN